MKNENLIYLLEVIASTASNDIESDEFEVVWEDQNGMEGWTTESITATAKQAADALKHDVCDIDRDEFKQQLLMSILLAERSETVGTDFEDGTYEQGVRDALQWVAGWISSAAPLNPEEYPEIVAEANSLVKASECKTMGPTCRGCPDCGPVMGNATYQAMFGQQQDGV